MNPLLIYMLKAALCLTVLYVIYSLFLSNDTMYSRNRAFILLSFASSLILPLIAIETPEPHDLQVFGRDLTGMMISGTSDPLQEPAAAAITSSDWKQIILVIYLTGMLVACMRLLFELVSLMMLIVRQK